MILAARREYNDDSEVSVRLKRSRSILLQSAAVATVALFILGFASGNQQASAQPDRSQSSGSGTPSKSSTGSSSTKLRRQTPKSKAAPLHLAARTSAVHRAPNAHELALELHQQAETLLKLCTDIQTSTNTSNVSSAKKQDFLARQKQIRTSIAEITDRLYALASGHATVNPTISSAGIAAQQNMPQTQKKISASPKLDARNKQPSNLLAGNTAATSERPKPERKTESLNPQAKSTNSPDLNSADTEKSADQMKRRLAELTTLTANLDKTKALIKSGGATSADLATALAEVQRAQSELQKHGGIQTSKPDSVALQMAEAQKLRSELDLATANLEKTRTRYNSGTSTKAELDSAQAACDRAQAELQHARAKLEKTISDEQEPGRH